MLSLELVKVQEGARALYSAVIELLPDIENFQSEVYAIQTVPKTCVEINPEHAILKSVQAQLELLRSQITQIRTDVCGMKNTIQLMVKTGSSGLNFVVLPGTAALKHENLDADPEKFEDSVPSAVENDAQSRFISEDKAGSHDKHNCRKHELSRCRELRETTSSFISKGKKCYYCNEKIHNRSQHMKKYHPGQRNFRCNTCGSNFDQYKDFQNHKRVHVLVVSYKCDLCNSLLKSLRNLRCHLKSHSGERPYVCQVCSQSFKNKASLAKCKHRMVGTGVYDKPGFQCKLCGNIFATMNLMNLHFRNKCSPKQNDPSGYIVEKERQLHAGINTEQVFSCRMCSKKFPKEWMVKQHMNEHTGHKPFKCEFCYKKFHTSKAKGVHKYKKHSGTYQGFKCKICGEQCKSYLGREAHYLTHSREEMARHNINVKMAECDICGKTVRKNYLTEHKTSHASRDSFICEICGQGFKRSTNLKKHSIVHMDPKDRPVLEPRRRPVTALKRHQIREKKYICNVCGKAFAIRFQLVLHNRIHTGERPHKCDICGKAFTTPQGLQKHEVVHTRIKAYKCGICGDSLTSQSSLKRHLSIHSGDRPFQCDICGKRFVQKVHLDCHRRVHTGERPFECNYCSKKFADPSTLHKHKSKHEKNLEVNIVPHVTNSLISI